MQNENLILSLPGTFCRLNLAFRSVASVRLKSNNKSWKQAFIRYLIVRATVPRLLHRAPIQDSQLQVQYV